MFVLRLFSSQHGDVLTRNVIAQRYHQFHRRPDRSDSKS